MSLIVSPEFHMRPMNEFHMIDERGQSREFSRAFDASEIQSCCAMLLTEMGRNVQRICVLCVAFKAIPWQFFPRGIGVEFSRLRFAFANIWFWFFVGCVGHLKRARWIFVVFVNFDRFDSFFTDYAFGRLWFPFDTLLLVVRQHNERLTVDGFVVRIGCDHVGCLRSQTFVCVHPRVHRFYVYIQSRGNFDGRIMLEVQWSDGALQFYLCVCFFTFSLEIWPMKFVHFDMELMMEECHTLLTVFTGCRTKSVVEKAVCSVSCACATLSANVQAFSKRCTQLSHTFCGNTSALLGSSSWQQRNSFLFNDKLGSSIGVKCSRVFNDAHKRQISVIFYVFKTNKTALIEVRWAFAGSSYWNFRFLIDHTEIGLFKGVKNWCCIVEIAFVWKMFVYAKPNINKAPMTAERTTSHSAPIIR